MDCKIIEGSLDRLAEYSKIPIRFMVESQYEIKGDDPLTAILAEKPLARPWIKDYDAIQNDGPTLWPKRWDVSNWGLLEAQMEDRSVGGCVLAHNTEGVNKLEGREDIVAVWDIRVHPDYRRKGIGSSLFDAAITWARERNCRELIVETQNINVPACRFYKSQGCNLSSINRFAYEMYPKEVELIWRLRL